MSEVGTIDTAGFDFDGTLADSCGATATIEKDLLRDCGASVSDEVFAAHAGWRFQQFLTDVVSQLHPHIDLDATVAEYLRRFGESYVKGTTIHEEALRMLERLKEEEMKTFIGSNNDKRFVGPVLESHGATGLFDTVVCADHPGVNAPKPAPDIIQVGVNQVGSEVKRVVYVGDTKFDIQAAQAAKVRACIGIMNGHNVAHYADDGFRFGDISLEGGLVNWRDTLVRPARDFARIGDMILSLRDRVDANQTLWL